MRSTMTTGKTAMLAVVLISAIIGGCGEVGTEPLSIAKGNGKANGHIAGSTCETFMGIDHCAIGQVNLTPLSNSLLANGFASASDGLTSSFQNTTQWAQTSNIDFGGGSSHLLYSTLSAGNEIMSLNIQKNSAQDEYTLTPDFIGAMHYTVQVYDGNTLVGEQDNVDMGLGTNIVIVWPTEGYTESSTEAGLANIVIVWPSDGVILTLPDGTDVTGNKVRFSAEHNGPSTFDQVTVTGTVESLEIYNESVQ